MIPRHRIAAAISAALMLGAAPASAQTGRIVRDSVRSSALAGNLLGDSPTREVLVYLPPGYDRSPDRRLVAASTRPTHGAPGTPRSTSRHSNSSSMPVSESAP